jgi:hypothetical protein
MTKIIIFADLIPQLSCSCNNICILLKHQSGKRPVLWIRKYFFQIRTRIRGLVILRYEFRSTRSLNYGTVLVLIRIHLDISVAHGKNLFSVSIEKNSLSNR